MSNEVINPYQTFYDDSGIPLANGTISFLVNTTTTLGTIFSDEALTVAQANPYPLDAYGRIAGDVKYTGLRTLLIKTDLGATVRTIDNVTTVFDEASSNKSSIKHKTLAEAVADVNAVKNQIVQITDRADGQFQYQTGLTPNTYNIVAADAATLDLALIEENPTLKMWGAVGDGVTDDQGAIQNALTWSKTNIRWIFGDSSVSYLIDSQITAGNDVLFDGRECFIRKNFDGLGLQCSGGGTPNTMMNFTIEGWGDGLALTSTATTGHGIKVIDNVIRFKNVKSANHRGNGFEVVSDSPNMNGCEWGMGSIILSNNNDGDGFNFSGTNNNASVWSNMRLSATNNEGLGIRCSDDFSGRHWQGFWYLEDNANAGGYVPVITGIHATAAGTTTGTTANKLVDSGAKFSSLASVAIGETVKNTTDATTALVTAIDSNTTLSLDTDIMTSGEDYQIGTDASAILQTGSVALPDDTSYIGWQDDILNSLVVTNDTNSETATITANGAATVTGTLSGGETWDIGDSFSIASGVTVANYFGRLRFCDLWVYPEENAAGITKDFYQGVNCQQNSVLASRMNRQENKSNGSKLYRGNLEQGWNTNDTYRDINGFNVTTGDHYIQDTIRNKANPIGHTRYYGDGTFEQHATKTSNSKTSKTDLQHPSWRHTVWNATTGVLGSELKRISGGTEAVPVATATGDSYTEYTQVLNSALAFKNIGSQGFVQISTGTDPGGDFVVQAVQAGSSTLVDCISASVTTTGGETRFLLYDVTSGQLERVKVGSNGSGPSGTGRALYIDDV